MASDEKAPAVPTEENEDELDDLLCSELNNLHNAIFLNFALCF